MTSSGDILNGGFRVLSGRPAWVLAWAVIQAALGLAFAVFVLPRMFGPMLAHLPTGVGEPDPAAQMALLQSMAGMQGLAWLMSLGGMFVGAVLLCGAFRAVLRPEEGQFAGLRVGMDEVRVFLMTLVLWIGGCFVAFILALILMLVSVVLFFALGDIKVLAGILVAIAWIAAVCVTLYAVVRLTLMLPLTFIHRRFVIDEAWRATRGRFWTLFVPYLVIAVILSVVSAVIFVPLMWSIIASLPAPPQAEDPEAVRAYMTTLMAQMFGQPFGVMGLMVLVGSALRAVSTALYGGAMATAAQGFVTDDGRLPEIFE